jgi:hypothetical protein
MSCDGNRDKYIAHLSHELAVMAAFGSSELAEEALQRIYQTAKVRGVGGDMHPSVAEARTRKLFAEMQKAGIKPPVHARNGLPRKDSQYGYAAIQQALEAARAEKPAPELTREIMEEMATREENIELAIRTGLTVAKFGSNLWLPVAGHFIVGVAEKIALEKLEQKRLRQREKAARYKAAFAAHRRKYMRKKPQSSPAPAPRRWNPFGWMQAEASGN